MPRLYIVKLMNQKPLLNRYRICEKVDTIDGTRDRLSNASFGTYNEARNYISKVKREHKKHDNDTAFAASRVAH